MTILSAYRNHRRKNAKSGRLITHLLDTDTCIYAMKGRDLKLARRLDELSGVCAVSDVSIFEIYSGAQRYNSPAQRMQIIENFANRLTILPFDTEAARIAGPIRHALKLAGNMIGAYDILIAATALNNNLTLVTNNVGEYQRVVGLKVENWVERLTP